MTKHTCWFLLLIVAALRLGAQDMEAIDSLAQELEESGLSLFENPYTDFALFAEVIQEWSPTPGGSLEPSVRLSAGVTVRGVSLGGYVSAYQGDYKRFLIFPNEFALLYGHFGGFVSYELRKLSFANILIQLNMGTGDAVWENASTFEDLFRDKFLIVHPEIGFEIVPLPLLRVKTSVGYRTMRGLELPQIANSDFSGLVLSIGVRVGLYKTGKKDDEDR